MYWMSFFVVLSYLWFGFIVYRKGLEARYHEESVLDMIVLSGVSSLVGGRLVHIIFNWDGFKENWIRIFMIMAYPGYHLLGLIAGLFFSVWILSRREEIKFFDSLDILLLGLVAGSPFERVGRVLIGETRVWINFPIELIQAILMLSCFIWLWKVESEYRTLDWYKNRQTVAKSGFITGMGVGLLGLILLITSWWGELSLSQLILGLGMLVFGGAWIYVRSGRSFLSGVKLLKRSKA